MSEGGTYVSGTSVWSHQKMIPLKILEQHGPNGVQKEREGKGIGYLLSFYDMARAFRMFSHPIHITTL